jgi:hemolysin activation/secretion protein
MLYRSMGRLPHQTNTLPYFLKSLFLGVLFFSPLCFAQPSPQEEKTIVSLQKIKFYGNTVFSFDELHAVLGPVAGTSQDMTGLKGLAEKISQHYHKAGYVFARAYLVPQEIAEGVLRIDIMEGQYGQVKASGDYEKEAQPYLSSLLPNAVIYDRTLEKTTLILSDQPGIYVIPVLSRGQKAGTSDLDVRILRTERLMGSIGVDNYGNRYSGRYRVRIEGDMNSFFAAFDQLSLQTLLTTEKLWTGKLAYGVPLGYSGLRGQAIYSHTHYELGKDFSYLNATGFAKIVAVGTSYPLQRSHALSVYLQMMFQHKSLEDRYNSINQIQGKNSNSLNLSASFKEEDQRWSGGITTGSFSWTPGVLYLDSALLTADRTTAQTEGHYDRLNASISREQRLPQRWSFFGQFSGQWATKNLDSSEGFGLGGAQGVRGYPVGEGYGDGGWIANLECRYLMKDYFTPFLFYDRGWVRFNMRPWPGSGANTRTLSSTGFGLRYAYKALRVDGNLARRLEGGGVQTEPHNLSLRGWINMSYVY